jgi:hypothetical protein
MEAPAQGWLMTMLEALYGEPFGPEIAYLLLYVPVVGKTKA